ncbi:MAG: hypothetical protein EBR82_75735 [Caulobacteraceae bacterium]|nr:hypothetical protein [Caulobacteraceae bacterium]
MSKVRQLPNVAKGSCYYIEYVNGVTIRNDWIKKTATITLDQWQIVCSLSNQNAINEAVFTLMDKRAAYFDKAKGR